MFRAWYCSLCVTQPHATTLATSPISAARSVVERFHALRASMLFVDERFRRASSFVHGERGEPGPRKARLERFGDIRGQQRCAR